MTDVQFNNNYDVFHSFLVKNADYKGYFELPAIKDKQPYSRNIGAVFKGNGKNVE